MKAGRWFFVALFFVSQTTFSQKMTVKDSDSNVLMEVNDEGDAGSITIPSVSTPSSTEDKLYNVDGFLYWDGAELGTARSAGGWTDDGTVVRLSESTDKVGIGDASPTYTLDVTGIIGIRDTQMLFLPDQTSFENSLFLGNGGASLDHSGGGLNGFHNTAGGIGALEDITTGFRNTAFGNSTLNVNTIGNYNTAIGNEALEFNIDGYENTAVGNAALQMNTAYYNTAVGAAACAHNTTGTGNTGLGYMANHYNQTGSNNTMLGFEAGMGSALHNKSGNVFIGYQAGLNETGSNRLIIHNSSSASPVIWGDFANGRIVIKGSGSDNTNNRTFFVNGDAAGQTAWSNDSDQCLKKNIRTIPEALDKVQKLHGVNFEWRDSGKRPKGVQMGFIAQEARDIIPEVVDGEDGHLSMQYAPITALLVEAVKELKMTVDQLVLENEKQADENRMLKSELERMAGVSGGNRLVNAGDKDMNASVH
ncbi:tail fiber domain-containing protein [bacterium]|nr:tail fiber domain-containing protein [bacterium]